MSNLEMKVDALMRYCTAQDTVTQTKAREDMQALLDSKNGPKTQDLDKIIRNHLTELGMPMKIRGFKYNVSAIALAVADPDITDAVISRLYPEVAKIHNTTPSKVERSMRHAIEVAWSRCDLDVTYRHFGNSVNPNKGKPTNSEFVARMAQVIRDCV